MRWRRNVALLTSMLLALMVGTAPIAWAQQSSSANYQVNEVFFGTGGELNACSTNYCSKQSAGELGVGNSTSANYSSQAGFNTDRNPSLTFIVTGTSTDLGNLSTTATSRTTGTFSVKTYLAGGYVVQTASDPPTSTGAGTHTLTNLASPTAQTPGTEQFGINLVANTTPVSFGANPVQVPSGSFSFGAVSAGYNTPNSFKYVKGDTVAYSNSSSGETDYTVSYIFNISNLTPSGAYYFNHVLVATSTF